MSATVVRPMAGGTARALLVGEAPAPSWDGDPRHLLAGPAFRRLAEQVLWPDDPIAWRRYLTTLLRANVAAVSQPWDGPRARATARALEEVAERCRLPIILLGRRAAEAFGCDRKVQPMPHLWEERGRPRLLLPHPSGRCRVWDDPEATAQCRRLAAEFMRRLP